MEQATRQVEELAALLSVEHDEELRDSVIHELGRLGDSAGALGLDELAAAALEAALAVDETSDASTMSEVAAAVLRAVAPSRFPPLVVVAAEPLYGRLKAELGTTCERVLLYGDTSELNHTLWTQALQGVVLPAAALDQLDQLSLPEDVPVFVYGTPADLQEFNVPLSDQVTEYFVEPLQTRLLLERVRMRTFQSLAAFPRAVVISEHLHLRKRLVELLGSDGIQVRSSGDVDAMLELLDEMTPDIVLLGPLPEGQVLRLTKIIRTHHCYGDLSVVVIDGRVDPLVLLESGALDAVDPRTSLAVLIRRLHAHLLRSRRHGRLLDPITGLLTRSALLRAVDRELANVRRGGPVAAVAVLELDSLKLLNDQHGWASGNVALAALSRCLENGVRGNDLIGRIGGAAFLVLLQSCDAARAIRRLSDIQMLFQALCQGDSRLRRATFSAGVADTLAGVDDLLSRADEALVRLRTAGHAGAIGE